MNIMSIIVCLVIINRDDNPMFKLAWIIPILVFPVFGWMMFLTFERGKIFTAKNSKLSFMQPQSTVRQDKKIIAELEQEAPDILNELRYIQNTSSAVIFKNTQTRFYPDGETMFSDFIDVLSKAEKYIYLEYFIIADGYMWKTILSLLEEKVKNNVRVYIIYDDVGSNTFTGQFSKQLKKAGINTAAFNPVRPSLSTAISYRDHRKIAVIDGIYSFTGGINLSDEYINCKERFGYWKDSGIMLSGEAVSVMAAMFEKLWNYCSDDSIINISSGKSPVLQTDGYVVPFSDKPSQKERTGEMAYMKIINNAKKYIYITTPYLILDQEMITAIRLAAGSGVTVKIITPHIPDKKYVQAVTRSNYRALLRSGVRIYEFTPGFIHSKTIVSDDTTAVVGTANFDFRSFYLLYENSVFMYKTKAVSQMKSDFEKTLAVCTEITEETCRTFPLWLRAAGAVLRLFSPLM